MHLNTPRLNEYLDIDLHLDANTKTYLVDQYLMIYQHSHCVQ